MMLPSNASRPNAPNNLFTTAVEKKGSPHTLVITKIRKRIAWDLDAWRKRKVEAKRKLKELTGSEENLRPLLGDSYDRIMRLELIEEEPAVQPSTGPLSATDSNATRTETLQNKQRTSKKRPQGDTTEEDNREAKRLATEVITID